MSSSDGSPGAPTVASPKVRTNMDSPPVEITIRQTAELAARAKGWPEEVASRYLQRALDRLDITYRLAYDLPPMGSQGQGQGQTADDTFPSETADGKQAVFAAWRKRLNNGDVHPTAKDANVLLINQAGGGMSTVGGWTSVAPGGTLTQDFGLREWANPGDPDHCVYGILHEVAHCLGMEHDPNWGDAWNDAEADAYYRTPTASAGTTGPDGETHPQPTHDEKRDLLAYHSAARQPILEGIAPVTRSDDVGAPTVEDAEVVR